MSLLLCVPPLGPVSPAAEIQSVARELGPERFSPGSQLGFGWRPPSRATVRLANRSEPHETKPQ